MQLPNEKTLNEMNRHLSTLVPREFASAVNLMAHPLAGAAALSALGIGVASHAFGLWIGVTTGAVQVSQRLFMPLSDDSGVASRRAAAKADAATQTLIADTKAFVREAAVTPEPKAAAVVELPRKAKPAERIAEAPKAEAKAKQVARLAPQAAAKAAESEQPAGPAKAKAAEPAAPANPVFAKADVSPAARPEAPAAKPEAPSDAKPAPALMPEDFVKPRAAEGPETPDDLKAISGIGPKLEKVLNELGVWTYAQVAALTAPEIAWLDDYLGFKGRIGRDDWIGQAARLTERG